MIAIFCLRLAAGMSAALLLLSPRQVNPRFFRTHFLTALGLATVALVFLRDVADVWLWLALALGMLLAIVGSVVWALEGAPVGRTTIVLTTAALVSALLLAEAQTRGQSLSWSRATD